MEKISQKDPVSKLLSKWKEKLGTAQKEVAKYAEMISELENEMDDEVVSKSNTNMGISALLPPKRFKGPVFRISKEEVNEYMSATDFIKRAQGRLRLFAKKAAEIGRPLYYRDFVWQVNELGDTKLKHGSFHSLLRISGGSVGLVGFGDGTFGMQPSKPIQSTSF